MRKGGEIPALTGLRGVAALLVVVTHFWFMTAVTPRAELPAAWASWTQVSDIGMAIFFTLSGFVIALSYSQWDWRARPIFNLVRLFFYRFARLYPAFLLFAVLILLRNAPLRDLSDPAAQDYLWPHLALWQSWWPVKFGGALTAGGYFHVSWSLSTECGLYLLFGLGAIIAMSLPAWRYKGAWLAVLFFALVWALLGICWRERGDLAPAGWTDAEWDGWLFQISPLGVSLQFGLGVAAYNLSERPLPERFVRLASNVGGIGLVAMYLAIATGVVAHRPDIALPTSVVTAVLMVGARADTIPNRLLSGRAIVYLGTISYSVYLFHIIVANLGFGGSIPVYDGSAVAYHALNALVALTMTILVAHGVYHLVEVPGRRAIRRAADRLLGVQREGASPLQARA